MSTQLSETKMGPSLHATSKSDRFALRLPFGWIAGCHGGELLAHAFLF